MLIRYREIFTGKKILVVDDEEAVAHTLGMIFRGRGFVVKIAGSAEQALSILPDWKPDIAVLDVVLPGIDGLQLAILLQQIAPSCAVVHLSGQPVSADLRDQAARRGYVFQIMAKPVHPETLLTHLADLLNAGDTTHLP